VKDVTNNIVIQTDVEDEDGNKFPASLTIDMDELRKKLAMVGYKIVRK
jgi:hypothetical protein